AVPPDREQQRVIDGHRATNSVTATRIGRQRQSSAASSEVALPWTACHGPITVWARVLRRHPLRRARHRRRVAARQLAGHPATGHDVLSGRDGIPLGVGWGEGGTIALHAVFRPEITGPHLIGAAGVGHLKITVDGELVADRPTVVPDDPVQAMTRPGQVRAGLGLVAGQDVALRIEFLPARDGEGPLSVRFGIVPVSDDEVMLAAAVQAPARADAAVVVVGSAELTESEGFD